MSCLCKAPDKMGLSNIEETQNCDGKRLPSEVWCLFRAHDCSLVEFKSPKKTCDKATSTEEECWWKREEDDDEDDFYSAAGDSNSSEDVLSDKISETAAMEQGELAEQLALVQQMVQEMKLGFSTAMEELANIQFGDQKVQEQMMKDRAESHKQANEVAETVQILRQEVENLTGQLKLVVNSQKNLEHRLNDVQKFNKEDFLEELRSMGVLMGEKQAVDSNDKHLSSIVQPYLASLPQQHKDVDDCDTQSVTALACKSLNLSQALHEKCLHLDIPASSDDDDSVRRTQNAGLLILSEEPVSHILDGKAHFSSKQVPPHEQFLEEVQREKSVQETVAAEKSYCSQLWNLIDCYVRPLQQGELMSSHDLNLVFPAYIPQLYEQHCILLRQMEERMLKWKYTGVIGDVLVKLTDSQEGEGLALYKDYINDFPTIINNINCWFSQSPRFRELLRSSSLASSSIIPLLLSPLQQIPRYSLLIKNMLKHTAVDHPDHYYLETALSRLKHFLGIMNSDLEHAMQSLNMNKTPLTRSRDYGNSTRSRSSGSSCEANQASSARDSGIHSNGEDTRQPASPNTTRKYVLQVLRDRREREVLENLQGKGPMSVPQSCSHTFGSHPDLSHSELSTLSGTRELPSHGPYHGDARMYSSLSKIPSRDPPKSPEKPPRKIKIRRKTDLNQKTPINSNYLRPLTPHLPFNRTPRSDAVYTEKDIRRPRSADRRPRSVRPASSIDFTGGNTERLIEQLSHGRPRNDLHMSLQRLLAERERSDAIENERYDLHNNFFQPQDASSVKENDHYRQEENFYPHPKQDYMVLDPQVQESRSPYRSYPVNNQEEEYGVFGDDDDDDDENYPQEIPNTQPQRNVPEQMPFNKTGTRQGSRRRNILCQEQIAYTLAHNLKDSSLRQNISSEEGPVPYAMQGGKRSNNHTLTTSSSTESGPQEHESTLNSSQEKHQSDDSSSLEFHSFLQKSETEPNTERQRTETTVNDHSSCVSKIDDNSPSKINTLERSRKYMIQTEQISSEHNQNLQLPETKDNSSKTTSSDSNIVKRREKRDPTKRKSLPLLQHYKKDGIISPISSIPSNVPSDDTNDIEHSTAHPTERTPKKLPIIHGRQSVPIPEPTACPKTSSAPISPKSPTRPVAKDTKIPLYNPARTKRDAVPRPSTPLSKSSEDVSKLKRKTPFKQSLKNFFGRKRKKDKCEKYEVKEPSSMNDLSDSDTPSVDVINYEDDADFQLEELDAPSSVV